MPELPDLHVFAQNLHAAFAGKKLKEINVASPSNLKDQKHELDAHLKGKILKEVHRRGKELRFVFNDNTVLGMHLMLNGDLYLLSEDKQPKNIIAELVFDNNDAIILTDWQGRANIKLNPEEKEGIDALAKELDFDQLKKALQSRAKIKARITDQNIIRGIGNAYADEILWDARIHPDSVSNKIPDEKIKDLLKAIKDVLQNAIREIEKKKPGIIRGEIRDFLKIHDPKKEKTSTGAVIKTAKKSSSFTYYTDEQKLFT
jgi:formamidopyrimidine-DNA glycosylase